MGEIFPVYSNIDSTGPTFTGTAYDQALLNYVVYICCQYIYQNVSVLIKILTLIYSVARINNKPCDLEVGF